MVRNFNLMQSFVCSVEYQATLIGEYTFNVLCHVENFKQPILVVITTEVVEVLPKVMYIDTEHQEMEIFENKDNIINVGQVRLIFTKKITLFETRFVISKNILVSITSTFSTEI